MINAHNIWLIPLLPLLAAGIGAVTPRTGRKLAAGAAIAAMAGAFVLAVLALVTALQQRAAGQFVSVFNFDWFDLGAGALQLGFLLDPLAAFMLVMVTFVGLLIFIFSLGYMRDDANFPRFFCFLSLFAAAMLGLIVANSLLLFFMCWELVGLASYLLIGFWFHKPAAAAAAKKAFITTRIGDLGLFLGMLWLYHATGTLLFYDHDAGFLENGDGQLTMMLGAGIMLSTPIALLIFCGAAGKSGQFPLHVWLPDAMEGPTPVSALIHAATMVAAGVFLVARVYPLMEMDQISLGVSNVQALPVVAFVGAITALLGSVIALAQFDLKRILAFSTVAQLGYMMLALGVGAWAVAIFHLLTHAFFKALLFLGAGSVIHGTHHTQDIRELGGLSRRMRVTFVTFAIGMMALAGVPFLFSGFWSKEGILHAAQAWPLSQFPFYAGLASVVLTAFYMTRLMAEVFFGPPRSAAAIDAHESPAVMTVPLVLLAVGAIGIGFVGTPYWPWLQQMLDPNFAVEHESGAGLLILSISLLGVGLGLGWWFYGRRTRRARESVDPLAAVAPGLFAALAARLGFDELYAATVFRVNAAAASLADWFDRWIWGGTIRGLGAFSEFFAVSNRQFDEDAINEGFDQASAGLRGTGRAYSRAQPGDAHSYLRGIALAFVVLALLLVWGGGR